MLTQKELDILEQTLNDELESYLDSGYSLKSEWAINIRNLMKKLNIKEIWDYDKKYKNNGGDDNEN